MKRSCLAAFLAALPILCSQTNDSWNDAAFAGLKLRSIGPATASGRVTSFAVHPERRASYFVGVASGGVWKTENNGTTWTPVFDGQGSYSIGTVVIDAKNPSTVWVGTGENNSQRSVGYGDGVYRSDDGGKNWRHVGLKRSEHIGRILIDPRDSNVVYVAAQGPLWSAGGDRGLYKTTDGGATWKCILEISENTGVTDLVMDPTNPDVLVAASYQRRRHVWTLINGGPESALHKTTDGGATWKKLSSGLPAVDIGRIGLAASPARRGLVYARIEAAEGKGGIFRSLDFGETWERRNPFDELTMYYGQIIADPRDAERIFVMHTTTRISEDGGGTLRPLVDRSKHVDTHTLWIDPSDNNYILAGCDGGVYESYDRGRLWHWKANLPTVQFYRVTVDESLPFYYVYGGTQDNFTFGGPSRTRSVSGIVNSDWFVTQGGDGFQSRADPADPATVYSQSQYGVLVRFDRRTGEKIGIQPVEGKGEAPLRWNWDSPLIISPHSPTRLYFAANKLFRSDDRGNRWKAVSGDLTRQLDRDALPVMGRIWWPEAVAKNNSTSFYGNIVALAESPLKEGLLYAGTDDGLIQVSAAGEWRKIESFPGVPERTYVSCLVASQHAEGAVYAAFNNHKSGDFKPYILKSSDQGANWTAVHGDLPENGPVWSVAEDPVNPELLFAGTEFGLFFTIDGGKRWVRLKGGMPTIAVRDIAIQKRENDLALATFGRGFYILDDYTPLRRMKPEMLNEEAILFPVRKALSYVESRPLGGRGKAFQGESFFTAPNPDFGALITYYLKDSVKTAKELRIERQKEAGKNKESLPYPSLRTLSEEAEEDAPAVILTITDAKGQVVRRLSGPVAKGFHRVAWDLRTPAPTLAPPRRTGEDEDEDAPPPSGYLAPAGVYTVTMSRRVNGVETPAGAPRKIEVAAAASLDQLAAFQKQLSDLHRAVTGALEVANAASQRIGAIKRAVDQSQAPAALRLDTLSIEKRLLGILKALRGDETLRKRQENTPPSIQDRVNYIRYQLSATTSGPTESQRESYAITAGEFAAQLKALRGLVDADLKKLESRLEAAGVPPTPGRLPEWK